LIVAVDFCLGGVNISNGLNYQGPMWIKFHNITRGHFAQQIGVEEITQEELQEVLESLRMTMGAVYCKYNETKGSWSLLINPTKPSNI